MTALVPVTKPIPGGAATPTALNWGNETDLKTANLGLLHEKFTHPDIKGEAYSLHLLKMIAGAEATDRHGEWNNAIKQRTDLLKATYPNRHVSQAIKFNTDFLIGLGNSHPNDVGLTWHPTLGFPYIPASAIKGLCRSVAETVFDGDTDREKRILEAFGPPHSDINEADSGQTGRFIFFDAIPVPGAQLILSGLTPHYQEYHKDDTIFPTDTESPVPISFLGVAAGSQFQFAIADREVRTKAESESPETQAIENSGAANGAQSETVTLEDVLSWLIIGLEVFGLGARTNRHLGFGQVV